MVNRRTALLLFIGILAGIFLLAEFSTERTNAESLTLTSDPVVTASDEIPHHAIWADRARSYRVTLTVRVNNFERRDKPAEISLNFTSLLSSVGVRDTFDINSLHVIEAACSNQDVDNAHPFVINSAVPYQFDPDAEYNAQNKALGTLIFLLDGRTAPSAQRCFHLYFDTVKNGPFTPASVTPRVRVTDNVQDAGQQSYKIEINSATFYYHKAGGGFSSLDDTNGNDWISYSTAAGASGEYRGIPNMVHPRDGGYFHPGPGTIRSSLISQGPLKATIVSTTADNRWQVMWDIFPDYARMTVLKTDGRYWFLYEGTPGGSIDLQSDFIVRSNGTKTIADEKWTGDLANEEWLFFADPAVGRSLFMVHHDDDSLVDAYYPMDGAMTVFGFGRSRNSRFLRGDNQFTVGLVDQTTHGAVQQQVNDAYRPLSIDVGPAEIKDAPPAATATATLRPLATNTPSATPGDPENCVSVPGNILTNPGFESGTTAWTFHTNGQGSFELSSDAYQCAKAAQITLTRVDRNIQLLQDDFPLKPDTKYRLSFAARSSTGSDFKLYVQRHSAPHTNYGLRGERFNLTTAWQTFSTEFTTGGFSGTTTDSRLRFWFVNMASDGDIYWIDDVQLLEVGEDNSPTATATATATVTSTATTTFTPTPTTTPGATSTPTSTATATAKATATFTPTPTNTPGPTATPTSTFTPTPTNTPGPTATPTAPATATATPGDPDDCDPDPNNLLANPGFESGTESWAFFTNGQGSFDMSTDAYQCAQAAQVTLTRIGNNMQLNQIGFSLKANTKYRLSFAARSSTGSDLRVYIHRDTSPNTNYGLSQRYNLSESWKTFTTEFTTTRFSGTTTDTRLRFWFVNLASNGDVYWIDDVQLEETTSNGVAPLDQTSR